MRKVCYVGKFIECVNVAWLDGCIFSVRHDVGMRLLISVCYVFYF